MLSIAVKGNQCSKEQHILPEEYDAKTKYHGHQQPFIMATKYKHAKERQLTRLLVSSMLVLRGCRGTKPNSSLALWKGAGTGTDWGIMGWVNSLRVLIGMAEAVAWAVLSSLCLAPSGDGVTARPAGVPTFSELMKSSKFIGSDGNACCSDVFRSCAIPLGTLRAELARRCELIRVELASSSTNKA